MKAGDPKIEKKELANALCMFHSPPREIDTFANISDIPQWIKAFEVPEIEQCLNPDCTKRLLTLICDYNQTMIAVTERVKIKKDKEGNVYKHFEHSPIAVLPKYMAYVYDMYFDQWFYAAFHAGKLIAATDTFNKLIRIISKTPRFYSTATTAVLNLIEKSLPRVRQIISAGLTDDTIIDPYGVIDTTDYGVEPLLKAYEWIRKYYPEPNAKWAWFNVLSTVAKVMTPLVTFYNKSFTDMIIYNVGKGGEGKTSLVMYILIPLLGGEDADDAYIIRLVGYIRGRNIRAGLNISELSALLFLNRLPLILDEQIFEIILRGNAPIILSNLGLQKYRNTKNFRGVITFTTIPLKTFLSDTKINTPSIRNKFIEVKWFSYAPINVSAFSNKPVIEPILGFISRLWIRYRNEFIKSNDLLELIEKLTNVMKQEYYNDAKVGEMVKYSLDTLDAIDKLFMKKH